MNYCKYLREDDFYNLTNADIKSLEKELESLKDFKGDKRKWLFDNKESLDDNQSVKEIISQKILAGQKTIKLFKIKLIKSKNDTIKELKSEKFNFNKVVIDESDKGTSIYSTLQIKENIYLIRLRRNMGVKKYQGTEFNSIKFVDVFYYVDKDIVEVRSDYNMAKRIINYLGINLHFSHKEIKILSKHKDLELFAKSINGTFKKLYSNTAVDISEISEEDSIALGELVVALDKYVIDKDEITFLDNIKSINFNNEKLTFSYAFLAGCKQIGISVSNDSDMDVLNQGLYTVLNKHLSSDNGYIVMKNGNEEYTIKVSTKSNTVRFVSSVSEKIISSVVDNVIDDEIINDNKIALDPLAIDGLAKEIEEFIYGEIVNEFRVEKLVERFGLNEKTVQGILNKYIKDGYIQQRIELISPETGIVIKELNDISEIKENKGLIFETYKLSPVDIDGDLIEEFSEVFGEYIYLKYSVNEEKIKEIKDHKEDIKCNISKMLMDEFINNETICTDDKQSVIEKLMSRTKFFKRKAS